MKTRIAKAYAVLLFSAFIVSLGLLTYQAYRSSTEKLVAVLSGGFVSLIFAPVCHELGHVVFGHIANLKITFVKCSVFKVKLQGKKMRFSLASPFSAEETKAVPKSMGDMKHRMRLFTLGGLVFSGIFVILLSVCPVLIGLENPKSYLFLGSLLYFGYLFLLNIVPASYPNGDTDCLIAKKIRTDEAGGQAYVRAMEIYGGLYEGKSFSKIDESYYALPVIREDEPIFSVMLSLRYRYYLELNELEKAGKELNRLATLSGYLSEEEQFEIAGELCYLNAVLSDQERANEAGKIAEEYLVRPTAQSKRILSALKKVNGKTEESEQEKKEGLALCETEFLSGVGEAEKILFKRL